MSDRPIQVGDLVQIVHQCCEFDSELGDIFVVAQIHNADVLCVCGFCGTHSLASRTKPPKFPCSGTPLQWLKRIPPLSDLEGQRTQEDIKEPA